MIVALAGCRFAFSPASALGEREREVLHRLGSGSAGDGPPFDIDLAVDLPRPRRYDDEAPAVIDTDGTRVVVGHARFFGDIEPAARRARLDRGNSRDGGALEIFLRVLLGCALPGAGGVLLHAAGAVIDGQAVVFCGRSGAGKSTLARLLPAPILSDELIAIRAVDSRFVAQSTSFWGTMDGADAPAGEFPLRAIACLGRRETLSFAPVPAREAMRRLVSVAVVPPQRELWESALPVLRNLIDTTAIEELAWTPNAADAARIVDRFRA